MIKNADGKEDMQFRIDEPRVKKELESIGIHSGGTLFGNPEVDEAQSLRFAKEVGTVLGFVDYRMAPENLYPTTAEDCHVDFKMV